MGNAIVLLVHLLARLIVLLGPGGTRAVLAENILLKQQLLILRRSRRRAPNLRPVDRVLIGFCSQFLSPRRLIRAAVILKPATLLRFHRGFKDFKYRFLYSSSPKKKPGPTGPASELIRAICELKRRNRRFGCPKIAQHLAKTFGIDLDKDVVRRVLAAHYRPDRKENGPSWLTLLATPMTVSGAWTCSGPNRSCSGVHVHLWLVCPVPGGTPGRQSGSSRDGFWHNPRFVTETGWYKLEATVLVRHASPLEEPSSDRRVRAESSGTTARASSLVARRYDVSCKVFGEKENAQEMAGPAA